MLWTNKNMFRNLYIPTCHINWGGGQIQENFPKKVKQRDIKKIWKQWQHTDEQSRLSNTHRKIVTFQNAKTSKGIWDAVIVSFYFIFSKELILPKIQVWTLPHLLGSKSSRKSVSVYWGDLGVPWTSLFTWGLHQHSNNIMMVAVLDHAVSALPLEGLETMSAALAVNPIFSIQLDTKAEVNFIG